MKKVFIAWALDPADDSGVINCGEFQLASEAVAAIEGRGLELAEIETEWRKGKKLSPKQLAKWIQSLPETTRVWEITSSDETTFQQADALNAMHNASRQAAVSLLEELRALDRWLTCDAENYAFENMRAELDDGDMIGYWSHFHGHLINAAGITWENHERDLNAELGRNIY